MEQPLIFRPKPLHTRPAGLCFLIWMATLIVACADEPQGKALEPLASQRPNVILIVVDTLRADHLGSYGYPRPTSPHIDSLAEDAIVYEQALSQAPWTTPSVGSLLSFPLSIHVGDYGQPVRPGR